MKEFFEVEIFNNETKTWDTVINTNTPWDNIAFDFFIAKTELKAILLARSQLMIESTTNEEESFYKHAQYRARRVTVNEKGQKEGLL